MRQREKLQNWLKETAVRHLSLPQFGSLSVSRRRCSFELFRTVKMFFFFKRPLVLLDTVQSNSLSSLVIIMIHSFSLEPRIFFLTLIFILHSPVSICLLMTKTLTLSKEKQINTIACYSPPHKYLQHLTVITKSCTLLWIIAAHYSENLIFNKSFSGFRTSTMNICRRLSVLEDVIT